MTEASLLAHLNKVEVKATGREGGAGVFRQIDWNRWELQSGTGPLAGRPCSELSRENGVIALYDERSDTRVRLETGAGRVVSTGTNGEEITTHTIVRAENELTGWLLNFVNSTLPDGETKFIFRRHSLKVWMLHVSTIGGESRLLEVGRTLSTVTLTDRNRTMLYRVDLASNTVQQAEFDRSARRERAYTHLADITDASTRLSGWLVNRVAFGPPGRQRGVLRQTARRTWIEDSDVHGPGWRTYRERQRDDWSVYLREAKGKAELQIDLYLGTVAKRSDGQGTPLTFGIQARDRLPRFAIPDIRHVNEVRCNGPGGNVFHLARIDDDTWSRINSRGELAYRKLQELQRDKWRIHLKDIANEDPVVIDLNRMRVVEPSGTIVVDRTGSGRPSRPIMRRMDIVDVSTEVNGWMVNDVRYHEGHDVIGRLRQTGWTTWVDERKPGATKPETYRETARDANTVTLAHEADSNRRLVIDTREGVIGERRRRHFRPDRYGIAVARHRYAHWGTASRITSRSSLTRDPGKVNGKYFQRTNAAISQHGDAVYRTSIRFAGPVGKARIWASAETHVRINGEARIISPDIAAEVSPSALRTVTVSVPATELRCPHLFVHTDLMKPDAGDAPGRPVAAGLPMPGRQRHVIMPDVELHRKIKALAPGEFWRQRQDFGFTRLRSKGDAAALQQAFQNISATAQHTYNRTPHGYHHDRALYPGAMEHQHFMLEFHRDGLRYKPAGHTEVAAFLDRIPEDTIKRHETVAQAGFFEFLHHIANAVGKVSHIVVHTVRTASHEMIETAAKVERDFAHTVHDVGEDLIHGDIQAATHHLYRGGETLGKVLKKGAEATAHDLVEGGRQALVVTIKSAGEAYQFVVNHTGMIGPVLDLLLKRAGTETAHFLRPLLDSVGWEDVLKTQRWMEGEINGLLDKTETSLDFLREEAVGLIERLGSLADGFLGEALGEVDLTRQQVDPPRAHPAHSTAVEKAEWLLHHAAASPDHVPDLTRALPAGAGRGGPGDWAGRLVNDLKATLVEDKANVRPAAQGVIDRLSELMASGTPTVYDVAGVIIEVVQTVVRAFVEVATATVEIVFDVLKDIVHLVRTILNYRIEVPFISDLFRELTDGDLTILNLFSLALAMPVTAIYRAMHPTAPLPVGSHALGLSQMSGSDIFLGIAYSVCHVVMGLVSVPVNQADSLGIKPPFVLLSSFGMFLFASAAQFAGNPIGAELSTWSFPAGSINSGLECPNILSHIIWYFQWWLCFLALLKFIVDCGIAFFGGDGGAFEVGWAAIISLHGLVHIILMWVLDRSEWKRQVALDTALRDRFPSSGHRAIPESRSDSNGKTSILDLLDTSKADGFEYASASTPDLPRFMALKLEDYLKDHDHISTRRTRSTSAEVARDSDVEWLDDLYNTWQWGELWHTGAGGGIPLKGFGNTMDAVPGLVALAYQPSDSEDTLDTVPVAAQAIDTGAHFMEAIVYLSRTGTNQLL